MRKGGRRRVKGKAEGRWRFAVTESPAYFTLNAYFHTLKVSTKFRLEVLVIQGIGKRRFKLFNSINHPS